jgi:hypothetical protein
MRADRFALGILSLGLCAAGPLSCGDPFKIGSGSEASTAGAGAGDPGTSSGGPMSCTTEKDCPGADVGCVVRACNKGFCGKKILLKPTSQVYGDCKIIKCSQDGAAYEDNDDADVYDDGNPCTDDKCDKGSSVTVARMGISCGTGNMVCDGNKQCVDCIDDKPCVASGKKCTQGRCTFSTCANAKQDGTETAPDCGGFDCNPCDDGKTCKGDLDCASNNCTQGTKTCGSTCTDNKRDGDETGTDCGGAVCVQARQACADGYGCKLPRDCMSGVCKAGKCQQPNCTDGVKNGAETGIDCGGSCGSCG